MPQIVSRSFYLSARNEAIRATCTRGAYERGMKSSCSWGWCRIAKAKWRERLSVRRGRTAMSWTPVEPCTKKKHRRGVLTTVPESSEEQKVSLRDVFCLSELTSFSWSPLFDIFVTDRRANLWRKKILPKDVTQSFKRKCKLHSHTCIVARSQKGYWEPAEWSLLS
jgi:hypothetical protein